MNINYHNVSFSTTYHSGKVPYFTGRILDSKAPFVINAFSTRIGGVSSGIYESMNLTYSRDDEISNVRRNFEIIAETIGTDAGNIVCGFQTHTTNILEVTQEYKGMGSVKTPVYTDIDGLITNIPGICLCTQHADCVPIYLVDPVTKSIGLIHSGWKGTVDNIAAEAIGKMKKAYNTDPADLIAFIGPSICRDCYEVEGDVAGKFEEVYGDGVFDGIVSPVYEKPGKYLLDLHRANFYNLYMAGINAENIGITDVCTCHNPKLMFSHRATKGIRGACRAFLAIR